MKSKELRKLFVKMLISLIFFFIAIWVTTSAIYIAWPSPATLTVMEGAINLLMLSMVLFFLQGIWGFRDKKHLVNVLAKLMKLAKIA